jgi:hypothetical protein
VWGLRSHQADLRGLRCLHETQYDLDGLRAKNRVVQLWNGPAF